MEIGKVVDNDTRSIYVEFLYVTNCDKKSIILQKGETSDYKWVSSDQLIKMTGKELITTRMQKFIEELQG